jgi:cobalamin-dependent methionine synthase I
MSALLTTTMPYMKVVIDTLNEKGIRDDYIVLVGGAPLNEEFGKAIGADAYCRRTPPWRVETAKDIRSLTARKHNLLPARQTARRWIMAKATSQTQTGQGTTASVPDRLLKTAKVAAIAWRPATAIRKRKVPMKTRQRCHRDANSSRTARRS